MHRVSREVVRYERERPGKLLHLDVKKPGRIPPGGGKRFAPGFAGTGGGPRGKGGGGIDYVHVVIDDRSRYACPRRCRTSAARRPRPFSGGRSTASPASASGPAGAHRQRRELPGAAFRETAAARGVGLRRTRPYRPQTNGKSEAFIKILQAEWAYRRRYDSNRERLAALPAFLREYDRDRPHGGIGGAVPASRL